MPRILKRLLGLAKSQPGLTRASAPPAVAPASQEQASGVHPIAKPAETKTPQSVPETKETIPSYPDPAKCKHVFATFVLPAEGKGRVYQCQLCRAIGFRLNRFGGPGNSQQAMIKSIKLYTCSRDRCKEVAVRRMTGRGPRGCYIWACAEHGIQAEGLQKPTP